MAAAENIESMRIWRTLIFLTSLNFLFNTIPGLRIELTLFSGYFLFFLWLGLVCFSGYGFFIRPPCQRIDVGGVSYLVVAGSMIMGRPCRLYHTKNDEVHYHVQEILAAFSVFVMYYFFYISFQWLAALWYFFQSGAVNVSKFVLGAAGSPQTLGQSAVGMQISMISLCCFAALFIMAEKGRRYIPGAVLSVIAATLVWLFLLSPLTDLVVWFNTGADPDAFDFQGVLLVFNLIVVFLFSRKIQLHQYSPKPVLSVVVCLVVLVLTVHGVDTVCRYGCFTQYDGLNANKRDHAPSWGVKPKKIVFCNRGADWSRPYYGKRYGQHSMGMFGLLPEYLKMRGVPSEISRQPLTPDLLKETAVLVVFNPRIEFTREEKETVHDFVETGGGLLVAGDHTDVAGTMQPVNNLIKPFHMALNFDTALPLNTGWDNSLDIRPHPVTAHIKKDYDTAIWVGASLNISLPAVPLIIGKPGWADHGNYKNIKRAFLGDYKRDSSELLGDVVLAGAAESGRGRVVVFGDTSSFQNGTLPVTHPFIDHIFKWLMQKRDFRSLAYNSETTAYQPAIIDTSHAGKFSSYSPEKNSLWGLENNLMRNQYIPLHMETFSEKLLFQSFLLIVIAPTREYTDKEIQTLKNFIQGGGAVIWSVGWEDMNPSGQFLKTWDVEIDAVPLGPGKEISELGRVSFVEAWPAVFDSNKKTSVLATKFKYPVIVEICIKKGKLILIGDSSFLLSQNMETYKKYNMDNIIFFRNLMNRIKRN
ncbi:MAG: hypothetical protein U9P10_15895 [Thermodesulfobacteriota bacterium]|nr:hypothetical protein [Thermodesulfobacteriota bacterium]